MHYLPLLYYSAVQLAQGAVLLAMTFRLAAVQLALTHGAVGMLMQSMAFLLAAVQPALGSQRN